MYFICSEVSFVEISSPNECDKILKIPNEQTEPTDFMANCSTDLGYTMFKLWALSTSRIQTIHGHISDCMCVKLYLYYYILYIIIIIITNIALK